MSLAVFEIGLAKNVRLSNKIALAGLFFFLAFLTKSTAVFLLLPGFILCLLLTRSWLPVVRSRTTYSIGFLILLLICIYYVGMNARVPGYFKTVWFSEVQRYYRNIMPWHNHPWYFYFGNLYAHFGPWIFGLPPCLYFSLRSEDATIRKIAAMCGVIVLSYLIVISIPPVKLDWYDAPVYPFLSLIIALGVQAFLSSLNAMKERLSILLYVLIGVLALWKFIFILSGRVKYQPEPQEREAYFLRETFGEIRPAFSKVVMSAEHEQHYDALQFYIKKMKVDVRSDITIVPGVSGLQAGDTLFACQSDKIDSIRRLFDVDILRGENGCMLVRIRNRK